MDEESHVAEEQLRMSQDDDDVASNHASESISAPESPNKLSLREQIRIRKEMEKQKEEAQFTFRPNVNHLKKSPVPNSEGTNASSFDRLYGAALKKHMTGNHDHGDKDLTFKPKISSLGAKQSRSSSRDRLGISRGSSQSRESSRERGGASDNEDGHQSRSSSANGRANSRSGSNSRGRSTAVVNTSNSSSTPNRSRGVSKVIEEQQAALTFRPSITKRAKSIDRNEAANIVERLQDQGKKAKEKMEQKKSELEQLRMQECTFAPAVVTKAKSSKSSGMDVAERLLKFEEIKKKKMEEALKKKQEEEAEELTFKPRISPRAQSPSPQKTSSFFNQDIPLEERLMTPTSRRSIGRAQEEANKELTFKPKLVAKRSPSPSLYSEYGSIHERLFVEGICHKRELEIQAELKRAEMDKDLTFTPEIYTGKVKVREFPDEHLFERLSKYQKGDPEKIEQLRLDLDADLTFQPQLTRKSLEIANQHPPETPIYERMKAEHDRIKREMELRHQQEEEEKLKEATFQPMVPDSSKELAKRRLEACIDAGGDAASVFSMSVHSRLASMYTVSSANQSLSGTMTDNGTIVTDFTGMHHYNHPYGNHQDSVHPRQHIVLPEDKVNEMVKRLAAHKKVEEPVPEVRAKVMSPQEYEGTVQRLAMQKTMSFTLKTDPAQLEAVQPKLVKEHPKVSQEQMEEILERLQSPTVSAAVAAETPRESPLGNNPLVRTASGRSISMSTSQYNLLVNNAAAGAAAVHGVSPASSPSPTRRHTLMSPPRASFFGTPLTAIHDIDEQLHHEDSFTLQSPPNKKHESTKSAVAPSSASSKSNKAMDTLVADVLADVAGVAMVDDEESEDEENPVSRENIVNVDEREYEASSLKDIE